MPSTVQTIIDVDEESSGDENDTKTSNLCRINCVPGMKRLRSPEEDGILSNSRDSASPTSADFGDKRERRDKLSDMIVFALVNNSKGTPNVQPNKTVSLQGLGASLALAPSSSKVMTDNINSSSPSGIIQQESQNSLKSLGIYSPYSLSPNASDHPQSNDRPLIFFAIVQPFNALEKLLMKDMVSRQQNDKEKRGNAIQRLAADASDRASRLKEANVSIFTITEGKRSNSDSHDIVDCRSVIEDRGSRFEAFVAFGPASVTLSTEPKFSFANGSQSSSAPSNLSSRAPSAVTSKSLVSDVINEIRSDKELAKATHPTIYAYRLMNGEEGFDDCGEDHAGARLLQLLRNHKLKGCVVVVARWFGGVLLGPIRFKHITNIAERCLKGNNLIRK